MLAHGAVATAIALSYVASIHTAVPKSLQGLPRDEPKVLRFRMVRVLLLCVTWLVVLPYILQLISPERNDSLSVFSMIGLFNFPVRYVAWVALRMAVMYSFPMARYVWSLISTGSLVSEAQHLFLTLEGFRNHVFAPFTEEFVYRGLVWACIRAGVVDTDDPQWMMGAAFNLTPYLFGVAHVHHGVSLYRHEGFLAKEAMAQLLFQMIYTVAFGILANQIYLASVYSLWCPILAHVVCNIMGIPDMSRGLRGKLGHALRLVAMFVCLMYALFMM